MVIAGASARDQNGWKRTRRKGFVQFAQKGSRSSAPKHPQPRGRGVQFGLGAVLQHSITPRGRIRGRGRGRSTSHQSLVTSYFSGSFACGRPSAELSFSLTWLTRLFISTSILNTLFWTARFGSLT